MNTLRNLWSGNLPLETAFWSYAVFGGVMVNALTSAGFMIFVAQDQHVAAIIVGYGLSLPYNLVVTVGVWRAAHRDQTDPRKSNLYRAFTVAGMLAVSLF